MNCKELLREVRSLVVDFIEFCCIALVWIWIIGVLTVQRAWYGLLEKYRGR